MTPKVAAKKKDERRSQILQAAMSCFAEKGYHLTTMDDIVAASGLSKGSIYWYYKSKREILMAMLEAVFANISEMTEGVLADSSSSASARLRRFMELSMASIAESGDLLAVLIDFWSAARHDERFNRAMLELYEPFFASLAELIEEGIRNGEFRPVNAANLTSFLIGAGDGLMMQYIVGLPMDWRGVIDTLIDVLLDGLRPR
jgi:AcrR family transcriptional regulator